MNYPRDEGVFSLCHLLDNIMVVVMMLPSSGIIWSVQGWDCIVMARSVEFVDDES